MKNVKGVDICDQNIFNIIYTNQTEVECDNDKTSWTMY